MSGLGDARLLVVNCLREQFTEISESDPIRILKSQKHELRAERDARKAEIEILKAFAGKMGDKPDLDPDQATTFVDRLFEKTLACAETVKALDDKIEEIKRKIDKAESEKAGSAFVKAVITIVANDDGPVQLKLTYRQSQTTALPVYLLSAHISPGVGDASWFPLYDLYASSEDGKPSTSVSLHYRVNVQQRTGEDWNDAKLILSTSATDMLDAGVPSSGSLTIQPKENERTKGKRGPPPPPPVQAMRQMSTASRPVLFGGAPGLALSVQSTPVPLPPLVQTAAIVSKSPMAVNYTVDEYTTIPSDHLSHKVLVAIIPFEATISHITSPRKSPIAYLQVGIQLSVQLTIKNKPYLPVRSQEYKRLLFAPWYRERLPRQLLCLQNEHI